jgi:hypothetical protein
MLLQKKGSPLEGVKEKRKRTLKTEDRSVAGWSKSKEIAKRATAQNKVRVRVENHHLTLP